MLRTYLYEEIAADLNAQIRHGEFDSRKLPSERALMHRYDVQRNTVRRALALLAARGIIGQTEKRGWFIESTVATSEIAPDPPTLSGTILVITQWNEASTALESLLRGLSDSLCGSQLSVQYFDSRPRDGRFLNELPTDDFLKANDVVGIVLWPQIPADIETLLRIRSFAPLVLVDRQVPGFETHSIVFDDFHGSLDITNHLLALGHRRIGFVADEVFAETVHQRWRGYARALEGAGVASDPNCYALFNGMSEPSCAGHFELLLAAGGDPVTAVVCSNDTVALTLLHYLRREGIRVPEDVAVTGFGNLSPNSMEAMGLTTVRQPFDAVGAAAGQILLKSMIASASAPDAAGFRHLVIGVQIVERASSGKSSETVAADSRFDLATAAP